jgi:hypothetical protein
LKILYHYLTLLAPEQASPYARWLVNEYLMCGFSP